MAYWIDESAKVGNSRQLTFFVDDDSDIGNLPTTSASGIQQENEPLSCLPCGRGSKAISIETSKIFILNTNDEWIETFSGESEEGSESSGDSSYLDMGDEITLAKDTADEVTVTASQLKQLLALLPSE